MSRLFALLFVVTLFVGCAPAEKPVTPPADPAAPATDPAAPVDAEKPAE